MSHRMAALVQQIQKITRLLNQGKHNKALAQAQALQQAYPQQPEVLWLLAKLYQASNQLAPLHKQLLLINKYYPKDVQALVQLANLYYRHKKNITALNYIEQAEALAPHSLAVLNHKSAILNESYRYNDAIETLEKIIQLGKADHHVWSNLGATYQSIGVFDKAESCFLKAIEIVGSKDDTPYNNLILLNHYLPFSNPKKIFNLSTRWQQKYARKMPAIALNEVPLIPSKALKVGMISNGFCTHPVGQMITQVLELLPQHEIELVAYSTNLKDDTITQRIRNCVTQWQTVDHLTEQQLANHIAADNIDILFDLSGHMSGSRLRTMAMKPAPILVKWVGGLVNTTGLSTMDYLLSDAIETPAGVDDWYTEKLIRMPNGYVCYEAPAYTHDVHSPPVTHSGYITLGCFNNPQKINEVVLEQWAHIMHQLPNSKLFLKSFQFNSPTLVENVTNTMTGFGITAERLILEGPSSHSDLLKAYNKVDIALDPWPYSGGLTTCEAMFMGVPVVTYPGPTFAGRHSATHLTNVGLGQLVAENWQHYIELVLNLANDVDNLTNIRKHLRGALLESPLCDAQGFARHFSNAMRAIWQRHCEGKAPASLSLDAEGQCYFADKTTPVILQLPDTPEQKDTLSSENEFNFNFTGLIIALEHGAILASRPYFRDFLRKGGVNYICLDPGSAVRNVQQLQETNLFQHFPLTVLGDGSELDLALAVEAERSTTLPISANKEQPALISTTKVTSHQLDNIDGLEHIDWLLLDAQHDNHSILEHGQQKLANTLLIEVAVSFLPEHAEQLGYDSITTYLKEQGYRLLSFSQLHSINMTEKDIEQQTANAIFIPDDDKMALLNNNQKNKLAFLLHTAYRLQHETKEILTSFDIKLAISYEKSFI